MKRNYLFLVLAILSSLHCSAQLGYRYHNQFIELKKDTSSFILIEDKDNYRAILNKTDLLQKPANKVESSYSSLSYYQSNLYTNGDNKVYILPKIAFMLKDDSYLSNIKELFNNKAEFYKEGTVYYVDYPFSNSDEVLLKVAKIEKTEGILWCEPDMQRDWNSQNTLYEDQYYLKNTGQNGGLSGIDINIETAWNITQGSANIVVAVIDQGVDKGHEDLLDRVLDGYTIGDANGKGAPKNYNTDNVKAHGMACAGIIGATDNNIGIKGIASNVKILPVNIVPYIASLNYDGFGSDSEIAKAIRWAYKKSDVLSCSWGSQSAYSNILESAFNEALLYGRSGKGCIIVASSGNNYSYNISDVVYPARYSDVIAVGAISNYGDVWNYSERGPSLDLVAPSGNLGNGGDVVTLDRMGILGYSDKGNYVSTFGGTSAACPQVAGVAALMLSVNPNLTTQQVKTILRYTARDLGPAGFDTTYGYGLVDAGTAVKISKLTAQPISGPTSVCDNATYTISGLPSGFTVDWRVSNNGLNIISGQGTTSVTVSKNASKSCTLYADIKRNGNIVTTLEKNNISVGTPMLGMMTPISSNGIKGHWNEGMAGNSFIIEGNSTVDTYDHLEVKVYRIGNNGTKTLVYTNNNFQYGSAVGGSYSNGFYELQVRGVKSCGYSQWMIEVVQVISKNGGFIVFGMDMDLSYDSSSETLNIVIKDDCGNETQSLAQANISSLADNNMYDVQLWNDNTMLTHFTTSDSQFSIPMSGLKHGTYVVRVAKGETVVSKKIIK